jgi:oxalate decarboxylase/phosphoglucose isomerase-like protein (cupin superfamily)
VRQIDPGSVPTQTFDWGAIKWLVTPERIRGAGITFGEVVLLPGKGHDRHNHPEEEGRPAGATIPLKELGVWLPEGVPAPA